MTLQQLNTYPKDKVRALLGLTPAALGELLALVLPQLLRRRKKAQAERKDRQRAPGGGRTRFLKPYQEVLLTLIYLRHNVAHAVVGQMFGVSADTSENTFQEVVALLRDVCPANRWEAEKKWKKREPSWKPDELDQIIVDSFETPVSRPSLPEAQRRLYSGKKKRHTLTSQVVSAPSGEILDIDAGHRGPVSESASTSRARSSSGGRAAVPAGQEAGGPGLPGGGRDVGAAQEATRRRAH